MKRIGLLLLALLPLAAAAQQIWATNAAGQSHQVNTLVGDSIVGETAEHGGMTTRFGFLIDVAVTADAVYVTDGNKDCVFHIDPTTGAIRLLAGGTRGFADGIGPAARFDSPCGLATDGAGHLYVADAGNHRIRRIDLAAGLVTTLAGSGQQGIADGPSLVAQFNGPIRLAADSLGNVYVTESKGKRIRQIKAATNEVQTVAGGQHGAADGGNMARFFYLDGLALDGKGNLYVADYGNNCICRVELATGTVTRLAGSGHRGRQDGPGVTARFNRPMGLAVSRAGSLYLTDRNNHRMCEIELPTGFVRTLAGDGSTGFSEGPGPVAQFIGPKAVAVAPDGTAYVIDVNYRVRVIR